MTRAVAAGLAAAALAAGLAGATDAASTRAVRIDCGTRVLAVVFLPGKRLVDIGDAAHRRLLVADRRDYVVLRTCRRTVGRPAVWRRAHASTSAASRLGCVFPGRVQLVVERASTGVQVLAAAPGSDRALLRASLAQRPRLEYDKRFCRAL